MIIEPRKQQNLGPMAVILFMIAVLIYMPVLINGIDQTNETGVSGGHSNHVDTITTPARGNCGCDWPGCPGCDGTNPQITLEPTVLITPIPPMDRPATPDLPGDISGEVTVFPTLIIFSTPTVIGTIPIPTIDPTLIAPTVPPPDSDIPTPDNIIGIN